VDVRIHVVVLRAQSVIRRVHGAQARWLGWSRRWRGWKWRFGWRAVAVCFAHWLNLPNRRIRDPFVRWRGRGEPRGFSLSWI